MSSIGCTPGEINVYDSLYSDLDETTEYKVKRVFGLPEIAVHFPNVQEQTLRTVYHSFAIWSRFFRVSVT